jgi:hypothetical protein
MITTPAQKIFFISFLYFTLVEQLYRLENNVVDKPFFMFLSELSNFIRNYLLLKVSMEVSVSDKLRCINNVPKYIVLKSLNDISVALFRASPQLYALGPHRLQYFLQRQLIVHRQGPMEG